MNRYKVGLLLVILLINGLQGVETDHAEQRPSEGKHGIVYANDEDDISVDVVKKLNSKIGTPIKKHHKNYRSLGVYKLTAYCPCHSCSGGYGRRTATGKCAREGHTIAVDPDVIGYGTKVIINGITYTAEDCGGGVRGKHIDIFFDTHEEVERFGKRYKTVEVME